MPAHMTLAKPAKGTAQKQRRARRRLVETRERAAKDAAKARDGYRCRKCGFCDPKGFCYWNPVEAAHLVDKGMGGDHGRHSHHQRDYVTLCHDCHQGPRSVHSGHIRMVYSSAGGDGAVTFEEAGAFTYSDHYVKPVRLLHIRVEHDA